jgi:hypothetical protein
MKTMVRRDLTNQEIEQMGREEPGSAAEYLRLRREELKAEQQKQREADDKRRYIEAFVAAGGESRAAEAAYTASRNEQAATAARQADQAAAGLTRSRIRQAL